MQFTVYLKNKKFGPVNRSVLAKWVKEGRVLPNTKINNISEGRIYRVRDLNFLEDAFDWQAKSFESPLAGNPDLSENLAEDFQNNGEDFTRRCTKTVPAPFYIRLEAAFFDVLILISVNLLIAIAVLSQQLNNSDIFPYITIPIIFFTVIIYYTFCLNFFKCTLGMRILGLKLISFRETAREKKIFRVYIYTMIMIVCFFLNLITVVLLNTRWLCQDIITGMTVCK
ncbi:MAG: RDD family protein [Victivallales bacterium]|nr:RDD family protein [Victivallales bacterium]